MVSIMLGLETEYAVSAMSPDGRTRESVAKLVSILMHEARRSLPYLPDTASTGGYLQNGSRLYLDCGSHPELSTPECFSPRDVIRYAYAGDRIVRDLADALVARGMYADVLVYRCNVDYSGSGATWGSHESYLHETAPKDVAQQIIPHLVSRIVFTGAGGFDNTGRGHGFLISPRVPHLQNVSSGSSTGGRGIFHTKDESLCAGKLHRLHILAGESLSSEWASYLRLATTALIVAMIDAGLDPGRGLEFRDPVAAMKLFSLDTDCRETVAMKDGSQLGAIDVQRRYLATAQANLDNDRLPDWAEDACAEWQLVLDTLQHAPEALETSLDWAIKLAVFRDRASRRGVAWKNIQTGAPTPALEELGNELREADTRFSALGETGIFKMLDRRELLTHRILDENEIEEARTTPPAEGRAHRRGELVNELAAKAARYSCDWQGVYDNQTGARVDLRNPFAKEADWQRGSPA